MSSSSSYNIGMRRRRLQKGNASGGGDGAAKNARLRVLDATVSSMSMTLQAVNDEEKLTRAQFDLDRFDTSEVEGVTPSKLVLVGYDDETGEPIYQEEPCVSNDNDDPYSDCTDVPTSAPTYIAVKDDMERDSSSTGMLVYECAARNVLCTQHAPGDSLGSGSGGSSPWALLGPCASDCPEFYDHDTSGIGYNMGDKVSTEVDRYVYACVDDEKCNENEPSLEGGHYTGSSGWTLKGGCEVSSTWCPDEYDADTSYVMNDEVSTMVPESYSLVSGGGGSASGISSGMEGSHGTAAGGSGSSLNDEIDGVDNESGSLEGGLDSSNGSGNEDFWSDRFPVDSADDGGVTEDSAGQTVSETVDTSDLADPTVEDTSDTSDTTEPAPTEEEEEEDAGAASYTYECTEELYCNGYAPGNSLGLGWTLNGTCVQDADCPQPYSEDKAKAEEYVEGDMAMITSDYLNDKVIGSISCSVPSSSKKKPSKKKQEEGTIVEENNDDDTVLVPYVYEVETSQQVSDANIFLPRLEEQILLNLADTMMSCFRRNLEGGERKSLRALAVPNDRRRVNQEESSTEYYVRGIESKPEDMAVTEGPCTISSPETDNCFIIDGRITLLLDPTQDDANYNSTAAAMAATDDAQTNLQASMENDDLLSPNMPEVIKVQYLADSYDNFLAGFMEQDSDLAAGAGGGAAAGGMIMDGNGMISDGNNKQEGEDGGGGFLWGMLGGILGAVIFAAMLMVCALFLVKRRRIKEYEQDQEAEENAKMAKEYDSQAVGMDFDWDEWDESFDNMSDVNEGGAELGGGGANGEVVLHVAGLGHDTTSEQIRELFEQHGAVSNCIIPSDHSRQSQNDTERFALLTMPAASETEIAEAESACNHMNGLELEDGNELTVREVSTLYVGNMSPDTTEEDIYGLFEQHGMVTGCIVPADNEGGPRNNRGRFALVTMPVDDAQSAETLVHGMEVDGHTLTVRDIKYMNGGKGMPGGGLAAAALAAGAVGAVAAFNAQGNDEVALHVGNLNPETTEGAIRELFERHGAVTDCVLPTIEEESGSSTSTAGYAMVTMPAEEAFNACNDINGMVVDGNRLSVREARQSGTAGRNLVDDSSSVFDNSHGHDANYSNSPHGDGEEEPLGVKRSSALKAMGGFMSRLFNKNTRNDEQLARLGSITGRDYDIHASPSEAEKSLDDGLDAIIQHIDSTTDLEDRRNFVVDPPGAFHLGNHHYTKEGARYFSPLCEQCVAARADEDGVVALKAISEEDDDDASFPNIDGGANSEDIGNDLSFDLEAATKFTDFNSTDLGRYHSSMHVRHCKSTTCNICAKEKGVFFVKSRIGLSASGNGDSSPRGEGMT